MTPMERFLSGKPEAMVVRALQWLLPSILAHWGDPEGFRKEATAGFMREAGMPDDDEPKAVAVVDQAFRRADALRAVHFRPFRTYEELEYAYSKIVPGFANSPTMQGSLWLAFQMQRSAIDYLDSEEGQAALEQMAKAVEGNKAVFQEMISETQDLNLTAIEKILILIGRRSLPETTENFSLGAIAGHIIETARKEARTRKVIDLLDSRANKMSEEVKKLAAVIEPCRRAELNEANVKFMKLDDAEKRQRFDRLRAFLHRQAQEVAQFAPAGFERFCQAVESQLYPYPAQVEWVRSYLKPMFVNAQQSALFDNCLTEASIRQRYDKVMAEKSSNVTMVELARAFAIAELNKQEEPEQRAFLQQLNLREEFNWPRTLEEMKSQLKS